MSKIGSKKAQKDSNDAPPKKKSRISVKQEPSSATNPKGKEPTVTDISVLQPKVTVVPIVSDELITTASTSVSRHFYAQFYVVH